MQTLSEIRHLLAQRGIRPKHRLGQNFLHDKNQLIKLLDAADAKRGDLVLEVGPGTGTLTSALLERGVEVIACELDEDMAGIIEDVFADALPHAHNADHPLSGSLTLIRGDALEKGRRLNSQIVAAIAGRPFKLIANLPYQIASSLISTLLIDHANCLGQFITIQKEVADRLLAEPGTKEYGPLSIIVQALADVKRLAVLSPSCFWPQPEVISAMVAITPRPSAAERELKLFGQPNVGGARQFAEFVVQLFSKRRKQLGAIFGRDRTQWNQAHELAGITPDQRPEALTVEQTVALWKLLGSPGR